MSYTTRVQRPMQTRYRFQGEGPHMVTVSRAEPEEPRRKGAPVFAAKKIQYRDGTVHVVFTDGSFRNVIQKGRMSPRQWSRRLKALRREHKATVARQAAQPATGVLASATAVWERQKARLAALRPSS